MIGLKRLATFPQLAGREFATSIVEKGKPLLMLASDPA